MIMFMFMSACLANAPQMIAENGAAHVAEEEALRLEEMLDHLDDDEREVVFDDLTLLLDEEDDFDLDSN
jgi:hypothetical protein